MFPSIQVSVEPGDDGPVVVKVAETAEGVARLATETDRLDRAAHPGVVEVLERGEGHLVLAWAGGQTLASYQAPFPQLAAVLTSLSATVADLHDLGIVHGTIQADHVIIGADGRPRLCGFGGPVGRVDHSGPADDVAAVGRLITDLLGDTAEIEPIPDRRWGRRRWSGYLRRALLTLADQASDIDAAHRPTARTLAAAIADAVPDARIEPNPTPDPLQGAQSIDLDEHTEDGAEGGADRSAALADADAGPVARLEDRDHGEPVSGTDAQVDDVDTTGAASEETGEVSDEPLVVVDHPVPTFVGETGPTEEAMAPGWASGPIPEEETDRAAPDPEPGPTAEPTPARTVLGLRTDGSGPTEDAEAAGAGRLRPVRRQHRTRDTRPPSGTSRSWRSVAAVSAAAAMLAVLGFAMRPDEGDDALTAQPPPSPSPAAATSPTPPGPGPTPPSAPSDCVDVSGPVADVDGDGCQEPVTVDATIITAGRQSFEVGEAGDALSLGDWNCDGQITPGLVRPKTGEVFLFEAWPDAQAGITVDASTVVPEAERLEPGSSGATCTGPAVVLSNGGRRSIERPNP